jgi:hypothetical protein
MKLTLCIICLICISSLMACKKNFVNALSKGEPHVDSLQQSAIYKTNVTISSPTDSLSWFRDSTRNLRKR